MRQRHQRPFRGRASRVGLTAALLFSLGACSSLGASGPSASAVRSAPSRGLGNADIKIVEVNDAVTRQVLRVNSGLLFSEVLGDAPPIGSIVGRGDVLGVTIWEAPPAALFGTQAAFGSNSTAAILATSSGATQQTALPEMMVDSAGLIQIPFAGSIQAEGRTPQQIERQIASRLAGKAHDPQVIVRLVRNANANVTVVGRV